jgi:hydrogenase maturation protease
MEETPQALILGIGNLLWADEGFGVRAVEALHREYEFPANVKLVDGGTQGLYLMEHVAAADILVVFDAIDYGLPPGAVKLVEGREVPAFMGAKKLSLHQTGFQDVLAAVELIGKAPGRLLLVGVQPAALDDYGGSLREEVKARIPEAIGHALAWLTRCGVAGARRETPLPEEETLACRHMIMSRYESERPSEDEALRTGDARVLALRPDLGERA